MHSDTWDSIPDRPIHYDRQGTPITLRQWSTLYSDRTIDRRRVAADDIGPYYVSTVWLGLDHGFGMGPPLIFETMVFLSGTPEDLHMQRYSTEAEALAGHEAICAEIRVHEQDAERSTEQGRVDHAE